MLGLYSWFKLALLSWLKCGCRPLCEKLCNQCKRDLKAVFFSFNSNLAFVISVAYCFCPTGFPPTFGIWEACHYIISSICLLAFLFLTFWPENIFSYENKAYRKCLVQVHTPAFGGRGFFAIRGRGATTRPLPAKFLKRLKNGSNRTNVRPETSIFDFLDFFLLVKGFVAVCVTACTVFLSLYGSYTFIGSNFAFDSSLGFPGEGPGKAWSNGISELIFAAWNTRSLTFERFKYCESLQYDVLALSELWRNYEKFSDGTLKWIYGKPEIVNGQPRYPNDRAAGVGLLLSARAQKKCISHGSPCERIVWARFKGPVTNVFVIGVHMPQSARKNPAQHNTMTTLTNLLKEIPRSDCIVIMGDLNVQLPANIAGVTGKWATTTELSKHAEPVISMMRMFELVAENTIHQPKKGHSPATFVQTIQDPQNPTGGRTLTCCPVASVPSSSVSTATSSVSTGGSPLGKKVSVLYKGKVIQGCVKFGFTCEGKKKWSVVFEDGYRSHFDSGWINSHLCVSNQPNRKKRYSQIDYILVSKRWASSITDSKVSWAPSIHRNIYGKGDHALVWAKWVWKIRAVRGPSRRAWDSLEDTFDPSSDLSALCAQRRPTPLSATVLDSLIEVEDLATQNDDSSEAGQFAHANDIDTNLLHGNARGGQLKYSDPPLTHSPNVTESLSRAKIVCRGDGGPTKPEGFGKGVRAEGRMSSCSQCPDPMILVRGRDGSRLAVTHPQASCAFMSLPLARNDSVNTCDPTKPKANGDDVGVGRLSHRSEPTAEVRGRAGLAVTSLQSSPASSTISSDVNVTTKLHSPNGYKNACRRCKRISKSFSKDSNSDRKAITMGDH